MFIYGFLLDCIASASLIFHGIFCKISINNELNLFLNFDK